MRKSVDMKLKSGGGKKWNNRFYVRAYRLARVGLSDSEIASGLGVAPKVFKEWVGSKNTLRWALREARQEGKKISEWIYDSLEERYKRVWDKICKLDKDPNRIRRIEMLFDREGEGARKYLFLYALVNSHFNPSQACKKVGVPYCEFNKWIEDDFEFARMVEEVHLHKKNLGEEALMELVEQREPKAVLYFNRTINRDRGYSEKVQLEHSGTVRNEHVLELDEKLLDMLSIETRKELLQATEQLQREGDWEKREVVDMENGHLLIPYKE
jgi:hypothetical protein